MQWYMRLVTEPKDNPEEALKFAAAFQQGAQQTNTNCTKPTNKEEKPVFAGEKSMNAAKVARNYFCTGYQEICKAKTSNAKIAYKWGTVCECVPLKPRETKPSEMPHRKKINAVHSKPPGAAQKMR